MQHRMAQFMQHRMTQFMQHRMAQDETSQLNSCNIRKHRPQDPATGTTAEDDVASATGGRNDNPWPATRRRAPTAPLDMEGATARGWPRREAVRAGAASGGVDLGPRRRRERAATHGPEADAAPGGDGGVVGGVYCCCARADERQPARRYFRGTTEPLPNIPQVPPRGSTEIQRPPAESHRGAGRATPPHRERLSREELRSLVALALSCSYQRAPLARSLLAVGSDNPCCDKLQHMTARLAAGSSGPHRRQALHGLARAPCDPATLAKRERAEGVVENEEEKIRIRGTWWWVLDKHDVWWGPRPIFHRGSNVLTQALPILLYIHLHFLVTLA
jgi:hypothetical protein